MTQTKSFNVSEVRVSVVMLADVPVEVTRKAIRTLRMGVYPPDARVRVSAPLTVPDSAVRRFIESKAAWIHRHRARILQLPAVPHCLYLSGDVLPVWGQLCTLRMVESPAAQVQLGADGVLEVHTRAQSTPEQRERLVQQWLREQLMERMVPLAAHWSACMGVQARELRIKRMKTRWGTCNPRARRIWINLELAKKPPQSLEYVMVHELAHLMERRHNARFMAIMDQHLPQWEQMKRALNNT